MYQSGKLTDNADGFVLKCERKTKNNTGMGPMFCNSSERRPTTSTIAASRSIRFQCYAQIHETSHEDNRILCETGNPIYYYIHIYN